jgi:hypothetical protein
LSIHHPGNTIKKPTMRDSVLHPQGDALLDNPIWNSLVTDHVHLAIGAGIGSGFARRYPADVGPLSAFQEPTRAAYADLAAIVPEGDVAVLFLEYLLEIPAGWKLPRGGTLVRMVCPTISDQRIKPLWSGINQATSRSVRTPLGMVCHTLASFRTTRAQGKWMPERYVLKTRQCPIVLPLVV